MQNPFPHANEKSVEDNDESIEMCISTNQQSPQPIYTPPLFSSSSSDSTKVDLSPAIEPCEAIADIPDDNACAKMQNPFSHAIVKILSRSMKSQKVSADKRITRSMTLAEERVKNKNESFVQLQYSIKDFI